jgi:hypothetical protein
MPEAARRRRAYGEVDRLGELDTGVVEELRGEDVERHAGAGNAELVQAVVEVDALRPGARPVTAVEHDRLEPIFIAVPGEAQGPEHGTDRRVGVDHR